MSDSDLMALRGPITSGVEPKRTTLLHRLAPWLYAIALGLLISIVWPSDRCERTEKRGTTCAR